MVDKEIIREWLSKAEEDFEFAFINLEEGKNYFPQICFHFHQAADKYLKAFTIAHELEFRKIHDLPLLLNIYKSKNPSLGELEADCEYLNAFYIDTRYPVHWPTHFSREETQNALQSARHIRSLVELKLSSMI